MNFLSFGYLFRNANSMSVLCIYRVSQHMMLRGRSSVRDWPKSFTSFTRLRRNCIMNTFSWLRMGAENMRHWVWCNLRSAHSVCCELVFCLWKGSKTQRPHLWVLALNFDKVWQILLVMVGGFLFSWCSANMTLRGILLIQY